jgi:hypothetical protein
MSSAYNSLKRWGASTVLSLFLHKRPRPMEQEFKEIKRFSLVNSSNSGRKWVWLLIVNKYQYQKLARFQSVINSQNPMWMPLI